MTFDQSLIHTCTIQEYTTTKNDDGEMVKAWSDKAGGSRVPFRFVETTERYADPVKGLVLLTRYIGIFHASVAISPGERINAIARRHDGSSVSNESFKVVPPMLKRHGKMAHHLSVSLELIK